MEIPAKKDAIHRSGGPPLKIAVAGCGRFAVDVHLPIRITYEFERERHVRWCDRKCLQAIEQENT